jgi:hypothetical protein
MSSLLVRTIVGTLGDPNPRVRSPSAVISQSSSYYFDILPVNIQWVLKVYAAAAEK